MVQLNVAAEYLAANHGRLRLDRFAVPQRPSCIVLTPRFRRSRHIVVLVLAAGRTAPALVVKLPRLAADGAVLAAEADNLRAAERALGGLDARTTPGVVAFERHGDYPLLLETAIAGRPLSPLAIRRDRDEVTEKVTGWLVRLAVSTTTRRPPGEWHERLVAAPLRRLASAGPAEVRALATRTLSPAEILRAAKPPLVFVHGDFRHPNLLWQDNGRLGVLDWERADRVGLPAHDLFFYLAYAARRDGPAAFFGQRPWAWRIAERYAEHVGIERDLLRPLLAVACARALEADPAAAPLTSLWRGALAG